MKEFYKDKKVLVTGGAGFLGSQLVPMLKDSDAELFVPRSENYDLRNEQAVNQLFKEIDPEIVIHLAVKGGGIGFMSKNPGTSFYDNLMMGTLMLEHSRRNNIEKFVGIGSVCSYPKFTETPFREENLWEGYPEDTNAPYGLAKKMLLVQSQAYRAQFDFNAIHLLQVNLYGPGDSFDPEDSHVIPSLINKFTEANQSGKESIELWGTGSPSREFLYVKDAAEGIMRATAFYNKPEPINLGSGMEISIKELAEKIAKFTGFKGKQLWDHTKPDGQPRRCLDTTKASTEFGFKAKTSLDEGLKKTIEWYENNYREQ